MLIDQITSPGGARNEDFIAVFKGEHCTDIVILDGGTSLAQTDYIDPVLGDVAWFVAGFASALAQSISWDRPQHDSVVLALATLRADAKKRMGAAPMPLYASPIAAMTWIRIAPGDADHTLTMYCLGDCKTFLCTPGGAVDLDPYLNPQEMVLQIEIARLKQAGFDDPAQRWQQLLPLLKARREFQNASDSPQALCLDPRGPFDARQYTVRAGRGAMLLAMTDGFYRIVDPYKLRSIDSLAAACRQAGLAPSMQELRSYEAESMASGEQSVKRADDASAISCIFDQE